jgi:hypothetical protein
MGDLGNWLPELLGVVGEFLVASENIVACSHFFVQTSKLLATLLHTTGPWSTYRARSIFYLKKAAHAVAEEELDIKSYFQAWCLQELQADAPLKQLAASGMLRIPHYRREGWTTLLHALRSHLNSVPVHVLTLTLSARYDALWRGDDQARFITPKDLTPGMSGILLTDNFYDGYLSEPLARAQMNIILSEKLVIIHAESLGFREVGDPLSRDLFLKVNTLL